MKTLKEHNTEAHAFHKNKNAPRIYTHIACRDCGLEMVGDRTMVLCSNPPCTWLVCPNKHKHTATLPIEWFAEPEKCAHGAPVNDCSICVNTLRGAGE